MNHQTRLIEKIIAQFYESNKLSKPFYKAGEINPLKIIGISNALPSLNLSTEEILFCYDKRVNGLFKGFVLTDRKFHFYYNDKSKFCELDDITTTITNEIIDQLFNPEYSSLSSEFNNTLLKIATKNYDTIKSDDKNDLSKKLTNNKKNNTIENAILTDNFLAIVLEEGNKIDAILNVLNNDEKFKEVLQTSLSKTDTVSNDFQPYHVVIQDVIFLYNKLFKSVDEMSLKADFIFAYLFERLQGNDMFSTIDAERLEQMIQSEKFKESIIKLKKAQFLKTSTEYQDQLILSSLLYRIQHQQFEPLASFYYSLATFWLNVDDNLSEEEKKQLESLHQICFKPKKIIDGVKQNQVPQDDTLEKVMAELNELIGLKNIKKDIEDLINYLKVQKLREEQGLKTSDRMLHSVFMGPPGTGKTTIARLLGRIYKHLGYLKSGHLVETDRAGMVAGFVGQTAIKVDEIIKAAIDGVLFIDEAYALAKDDGGRDFGHEAIETLLKRMEDHRDDLVVIAAGYPDEMKEFIQSNPGLQSRFNRYFNFDHYVSTEMLEIFKLNAKKADYVLTTTAVEKVSFIFDGLYEKRNKTFGNARVVRNIFEQCMANQANRIIVLKDITKEILMCMDDADIPEVKDTIKKVFVFQD